MLAVSPSVEPDTFDPLSLEQEKFPKSPNLGNQRFFNTAYIRYPRQAAYDFPYSYETSSSGGGTRRGSQQAASSKRISLPPKSIQKDPCRNTQETGFQCLSPNCGKVFSKKWNLKAHKRIHTGSKPCKCRLGRGAAHMWLSSLKGHQLRRYPLLPESARRKNARGSSPPRSQDTNLELGSNG